MLLELIYRVSECYRAFLMYDACAFQLRRIENLDKASKIQLFQNNIVKQVFVNKTVVALIQESVLV